MSRSAEREAEICSAARYLLFKATNRLKQEDASRKCRKAREISKKVIKEMNVKSTLFDSRVGGALPAP